MFPGEVIGVSRFLFVLLLCFSGRTVFFVVPSKGSCFLFRCFLFNRFAHSAGPGVVGLVGLGLLVGWSVLVGLGRCC